MDEIKGIPFWNYVNSDESLLNDRERPRDQFWFKLDWENSWNIDLTKKFSNKQSFFKVERYLNIAWPVTSYQDIPFNKEESSQGVKSEQYWNIASLNSDWYIEIKHSWIYQICVVAQYLKDWAWTWASLYNWPCWWYIRKESEKSNWDNKPHMMVSSSSISFVVRLDARDVLVPQAWWTVDWTIWFAVTKLS